MFRKPAKPFTRTGKSGVARIKRDNYGPNWFTIANDIRKRDNHTCQEPGCGAKEDPKDGVYHHVHHIISLSRGGTTTKSNLILLCTKHHKRRHKHM